MVRKSILRPSVQLIREDKGRFGVIAALKDLYKFVGKKASSSVSGDTMRIRNAGFYILPQVHSSNILKWSTALTIPERTYNGYWIELHR
jgi:hypothetical protein